MKNYVLFSFLLVACCFQGLFSQTAGYRYSLNLEQVVNDKLEVVLEPPALSENEVIFSFPKMVPGTYSIYDFGRFISDFSAIGKDGKKLSVEKTDENSWKIKGANHLKEIRYKVEDSFDSEVKGPKIFQPAGTNIEAGKNFLLNNFGFFGYFRGMTEIPFQLNITRPADFYAATGLDFTSSGNVDRFDLPNYFTLADGPIMYCKPDTTIVKVGNTDVIIGVYDPGKQLSSEFIASNISEILQAQKNYLDGTLPVSKYAFILYFTTEPSFGGGALEHHNSSVYYFSSAVGAEALAQTLRDVSAHEFFHIVTPLTLHSEEIRYFDFNNPVMSEHLWLYEGCTEYFAHHVQVVNNLISLEDYIEDLSSKINTAANFNDTLPFTVMSKNCLDIYKNQYLNVYQKGALIGMSLDILIRKYSEGKRGLMDVLQELSKKYGIDKPFKDAELFNEITHITYPQIGDFLRKYVSGNTPLPLAEILAEVGIEFREGAPQMLPDIGFNLMEIGVDETQTYLVVPGEAHIFASGKKMGLQPGDKLITINKIDVSVANVAVGFTKAFSSILPGDPVEIEVGRMEKSKLKKKKLKGTFQMTQIMGLKELNEMENLTPEQLTLRKYWIGQ